MPTVYVYAPFTGRIAGLDNYCSGGAHAPCRNAQPTQVSPVDIATSGVVLKIYFYAGRSSKVYISTENRCCCSNTGSYGRTRIVDIFSIEGCYVGSVWFGHVDYIPYCRQIVTGGTTPIYRFDYSIPCPTKTAP
jgi:hypothetical protein